MAKHFEIGNEVAFSMEWLISTKKLATNYARARGRVVNLHYRIHIGHIAQIVWNDKDIPEWVNFKYLVRVQPRKDDKQKWVNPHRIGLFMNF
jgi:hypothetical protein